MSSHPPRSSLNIHSARQIKVAFNLLSKPDTHLCQLTVTLILPPCPRAASLISSPHTYQRVSSSSQAPCACWESFYGDHLEPASLFVIWQQILPVRHVTQPQPLLAFYSGSSNRTYPRCVARKDSCSPKILTAPGRWRQETD